MGYSYYPAAYANSDVDTHLNQSSATSGQYLQWNGSDYAWATVSAGSSYTDSDVDAHLLTAGITLDATNDRLGIGQSSPDNKIHISAARPVIDVEDTAAGHRAKFACGYNNTYIGNTSSNGEFIFKNNIGSSDFPHASGDTLMTIASDGKVGIGDTSPVTQLEVKRPTQATGIHPVATFSTYSANYGYGAAIDFAVDWGGYITTAQIASANVTGGGGYGGELRFSTNGQSSAGSMTERMRLGSTGSLNCAGVYNDTTTSSTNVNVASDGHIRRVVSSRRYKNTITDATHGLTELLTLRPVTYKGNNEDFIVGGLIAEEVHDAGLTEFVEYDDDGEPDSLAYSNMVSLCIKAIQEQQTTITAQAAKIETLETQNTTQATQIADLTTRLEALEAN